MKYIKKIILENFQSHKHTEVEFGPELNVIVGPSDSGKSAIIRGLKWVMYNEPAGDFFIREGENDCSVSLVLSEGTTLQRYRTRSKNGYKLTTNDGVEMKFEGIGATVPQEIIDITGIRKMQLDGDSSNAINLGEQLEGAFLLTEKASTRANAIGRLVGVDVVDDALREVLKDMRSLSQNKKLKEDSLSEIDDKIQEYKYLDELKTTYEKVDAISKKLHDLQTRTNLLEDHLATLNKLKKDLSSMEDILTNLSSIDNIESFVTKAANKVLSHDKLSYISNSINKNNTQIKDTADIISILANLEDASIVELEVQNRVLKLSVLKRILGQISIISKETVDLQSIQNDLMYSENATTSVVQADDKNQRLQRLNYLQDKYNITNSSIKKGNKYINRLIPFIDKGKGFDEIEERVILLRNLNKQSTILDTNKANSTKYKHQMISNNKEIDQIREKYRILLSKIEKCPFCLGDIDEDTINHIITHHIGG